jgi:hypothetical protein
MSLLHLGCGGPRVVGIRIAPAEVLLAQLWPTEGRLGVDAHHEVDDLRDRISDHFDAN